MRSGFMHLDERSPYRYKVIDPIVAKVHGGSGEWPGERSKTTSECKGSGVARRMMK